MNQLTPGPKEESGRQKTQEEGEVSCSHSAVALEIGDTFEEAVNINETTTKLVDETEPAENAENAEKLGNSLIVISATDQTLLKRV